jgi:hypothetical protein
MMAQNTVERSGGQYNNCEAKYRSDIARFLPFEGLVKDVGLTGNYADKTKPLQVPSLVGVFISRIK